jgi:hypothetical protein
MDPDKDSDARSWLPLLLGGTVGSFFFLGLTIITGGYFLYFLLLVGGVVLLGWVHYLLWGKLLSEQTAGEREEEQVRQQADDWQRPDARMRR